MTVSATHAGMVMLDWGGGEEAPSDIPHVASSGASS